MIFHKTEEEIELIRQSCLLVSKTLAHVGSILKPGITGLEIDKAAETFIRDHEGAVPGFKGYNDFPATLCVSKNEVVVHGIPNKTPFTEDDIVSVDCGVYWNEFFGDAAYTFAFKGVGEDVHSSDNCRKRKWLWGCKRARWTWIRSKSARSTRNTQLWVKRSGN